MRNKILGTIGILWGGFAMYNYFATDAPAAGGAYATGRTFGLLLAIAMFGAGIYAVTRE